MYAGCKILVLFFVITVTMQTMTHIVHSCTEFRIEGGLWLHEADESAVLWLDRGKNSTHEM